MSREAVASSGIGSESETRSDGSVPMAEGRAQFLRLSLGRGAEARTLPMTPCCSRCCTRRATGAGCTPLPKAQGDTKGGAVAWQARGKFLLPCDMSAV